MNKENLGKCATDQAIRKITFKKNPKTGKTSKVIKITHTQKCSQDKELIALEEEDNKEQEEEINTPQAPQDELREKEDKDMEIIREEFRRYLRGVVK